MKGDSQRVQHGVHVPIERVLFPTDISQHAAAAWPLATGLAREGRAELHVLHVLGGGPPLTATTRVAGVLTQVQMCLGELASSARELGIRTRTHTTYGDPASEVVAYAREHGIGAIVMSTTGRTGLAHVLMGSVAEQVVRHADCPVVTVRDDAAFARSRAARGELPRLRRILVPLDGSRLAEALLPHIVRLAKRHGATLMLLRVADAHSVREAEVRGAHEAETYLAGVAHRLAAEGVSASPLVRCGGTAEEILDDIWDRHPDLVAMTSTWPHGAHPSPAGQHCRGSAPGLARARSTLPAPRASGDRREADD